MKHSQIMIPVINKKFTELNPIDAGYEQCRPEHSFGPHVRSYWLIHYVLKGKGKVIKNNSEVYEVHEGQAFLISPELVYLYCADKYDPWEYVWIGFNGSMAPDFEQLGDVFETDRKLFLDIINAKEYNKCREEFLESKLFALYTSLFCDMGGKIDYVTQVCDYIEAHYSENILISEVAKIIGVDRTYLAKLFKQRHGKSMQNYLIDVRIKMAETFLQRGYTVNETAVMVGYDDVSNFSKMFKKVRGEAPKHMKKK